MPRPKLVNTSDTITFMGLFTVSFDRPALIEEVVWNGNLGAVVCANTGNVFATDPVFGAVVKANLLEIRSGQRDC